MKPQTGPPPSNDKTSAYSPAVARTVNPKRGPRPEQGARLLGFRQAAGLTQIELAKALDVSPANIAFWEWSATPPRSDVLPKMAQVFDVPIDQLIAGYDGGKAKRKAPEPVGELQRAFEAVKRLPRRQQRKIVEMVLAMVDRLSRKTAD